MTWRHRVAALGALLGAGACQDPSASEQRLRVTTAVDVASRLTSSFLNVRIVARNVSARAVVIAPNECMGNFIVENAKGERVGPSLPPNFACILMITAPLSLAAGDSLVFKYEWPLAGEGGDRTWATERYPPGEYRLRGAIFGPDLEVYGDRVRVTVR